MKKLILFIMTLLLTSVAFAQGMPTTMTTFNPFTGKLDYINSLNQTGKNITASFFFGNGTGITGLSFLKKSGDQLSNSALFNWSFSNFTGIRKIMIGNETKANFSLDIRGRDLDGNFPTVTLHVALDSFPTAGMFLQTVGPNDFTMSTGCHFDGTQWMADTTNCTQIQASRDQLIFYANNGLTIGNSFTQTKTLRINQTGIRLPNDESSHGIYDNTTCSIITGDTSSFSVC